MDVSSGKAKTRSVSIGKESVHSELHRVFRLSDPKSRILESPQHLTSQSTLTYLVPQFLSDYVPFTDGPFVVKFARVSRKKARLRKPRIVSCISQKRK